MPHESPAAVELDLTVPGEAGPVVLIEAEVAEVVEHRLHTQMVCAPRRISRHQFLPRNRMHGIQLLQQIRQLGAPLNLLRPLPMTAGVLPQRRPQRRLPPLL